MIKLQLIYILTLILLLRLSDSFGQTKNKTNIANKWTIGTILYNELSGTPNYFGGINIKRQFTSFNIRAGIEYANHLD